MTQLTRMAAHMTFNIRYGKVLICIALVVILLYIPMNVIYVVSTIKPRGTGAKLNTEQHLNKDSSFLQLGIGADGPLSLRDISPENDGSVNLILNLNVKKLMDLLDPSANEIPPGEMTGNPIPIQPNFIIHNENLCKNVPDLQWIIYVHSAPKNTKRRQLMRSAWASPDLFKKDITRLVFLMGKSQDQNEMTTVKLEQQKYNDIVIGDFIDHYKNLTLKAIMGLKWVSTYCPNAPYAVKADDDAFVNIFEVMEDLKKYASKKKMMYCPLWKDKTMPILRDPKKCMKWCVKYNEFPGRTHFPQYCAGLSFVMSRDIVSEMYNASLSTPFFWIDDVYISGLLTAKVKDIEFVDVMSHFTLKEPLAMEDYSNPSVTQLKYYFIHGKTPEKFEKFWNQTLHRLPLEKLDLLTDKALIKFPDLQQKLKNRHSLSSTKGH